MQCLSLDQNTAEVRFIFNFHQTNLVTFKKNGCFWSFASGFCLHWENASNLFLHNRCGANVLHIDGIIFDWLHDYTNNIAQWIVIAIEIWALSKDCFIAKGLCRLRALWGTSCICISPSPPPRYLSFLPLYLLTDLMELQSDSQVCYD
jgi:hypothetical protein